MGLGKRWFLGGGSHLSRGRRRTGVSHGVALGSATLLALATFADGATGQTPGEIKLASLETALVPIPVRAHNAATRNPKPVHGPLQIVVSVPDQRIDVFKGTERVATSRVSTGKRGYDTPEGVFSIIQKNRRHYSNIYRGAPMPFMQRLTWSGIALHAGVVPRYPASHGCIRLPHGFAKKLFSMTDKGLHIVVNRNRQRPVAVEHDTLFHPRPPSITSLAGVIQSITLGGLGEADLARRDRKLLLERKTGRFAMELRKAYHPNKGSHRRATTRLVQTLLVFLEGYGLERADGDLGPVTRRAIRAFQRDHGLARTGRVSERLINRLYGELARRMIAMAPQDADKILTPASKSAPLRILVTRTLDYNPVKRAQRMLESLGYYIGAKDGKLGRWTRYAIKQFRRKAKLRGPAKVDEPLLAALMEAANFTPDDSSGRLHIRQGFRDVMTAPVVINDIERALGTHVFTAMDFGPERSGKIAWTALSVAEKRHGPRRNSSASAKGAMAHSGPAGVLDRITVPDDVRRYIEEHMQPGTSMIVTDHGISHETGEGTDFVVLTR